MERDQVGPTQGRCFLLEGLVGPVRAVLIQDLVKTDDLLIVIGPQARIRRSNVARLHSRDPGGTHDAPVFWIGILKSPLFIASAPSLSNTVELSMSCGLFFPYMQ